MANKSLIKIICTGISCCSIYSGLAQKKQPNIVFIFSDDHATQAISAYNGLYKNVAPTPNIDLLAKEGAILTNVFCTNAISGPSRACVLTGKYNHINRYYKNEGGGVFDNSQWTFPKELQQNGYQTSIFGKWHLASEPTGFNFYKYHNNPGQQGTYYDPVYNENGRNVKEKGYSTTLTADFALDWLSNVRNKDKPFCILLQFKAPHREWSPDSLYLHLYDSVEIPYPKTFDDSYTGREKTAGNTYMTMAYLNRLDMKMTPPDSMKGEERLNWLKYGNNPGENFSPLPDMTPEQIKRWKYQKFIKDYLACVRSVDDNVGKVLEYLKKTGLDKNTIVIYSSDQGFYLGDHGWFDKRFMYDPSLRMPFLISYPNVIKPGTVCNDIITNIDFAPTILDIAGITSPKEVQGRSFLPNLIGKTPLDWQKSMYYHYYEYPFWHHVEPHFGIRNERYKLIHFYYDIDLWEFYDLKTDPDELNNRVADSVYSKKIIEMKRELKKLMKKYGNDKPLDEFRKITDTDFGGLKSPEQFTK